MYDHPLVSCDDHLHPKLLQSYGAHNPACAPDYPHPDSVWPNPRATLGRRMGHSPPETIRGLTFENAARLHGLGTHPPEDALAVAGK